MSTHGSTVHGVRRRDRFVMGPHRAFGDRQADAGATIQKMPRLVAATAGSGKEEWVP